MTRRKYGNTQIEFNGRLYISVEILAERTGYSVITIRHLARQERIPSIKFGRRWMFNLQDVMATLAPNLIETDASEPISTSTGSGGSTSTLLSRI